jgi:hypothetical protein
MKKGRTQALWGAYLQLGAVICLLVAVIRMIGAFGKEGTTASPATLAESIAIVISGPTLIGSVLSLVGLVLLMVALFNSKYRAPWFFWFMVIYAVLSLLAFPIGTILGVIILVYTIPKKEEFMCDRDRTNHH